MTAYKVDEHHTNVGIIGRELVPEDAATPKVLRNEMGILGNKGFLRISY